MKNKLYISLLYILLQYTLPAYCTNNFFFSQLGVENGLSQLSVLQIFEDSEGYIWFGTRNGANRYDGYEFVIYQNEVNNKETLSDNYIRCFAEDKNQNIWVGTSNGLNCIDRKTRKVTRYYPQLVDKESTSNVINRLMKHADGTVYAFSSRCILKCNADKTVEPTTFGQEIQSPIYSVTQDTDGDILIGTESSGLYIYSNEWQLKKHISSDNNDKTENILHSTILTILSDKEGNIWMGTAESGICLYNKQTQKITCLNKENSDISSNSIRALIHYDNGAILAGTFGGLNLIQKKNQQITITSTNITGKGGLTHFSVHSLLVDKNQTLWVGTYYGANYHSPYYKPVTLISTNEYTGISGKGQEDKDRNMWFATEGSGLFRYTPSTGEQALYPLLPVTKGNYEFNILKSILIKGDSILCSTHFGAVYLFSIRNKTYKRLYDFKHNDIYGLTIDSQDRFWIPTNSESGLVMIDNGQQTNLFNANGTLRLFKGITCILEMEPNLFLFGSINDSIYVYDRKNHLAKEISVTLNSRDRWEKLGNITGIQQDKDGYIWISTGKNGLYRLNKGLQIIKHYQKEDGLSQSQISSLTIDHKQNVWVTTGSTLYLLDRKNDTFYEIKTTDLPSIEFTQYCSGNLASDGTVYFPGDKGILAINPDKVTVNPNLPAVYVNSLVVNNQYDVTSLIDKNAITLESNQNNITIKYTALNFIQPEKNQYTYKLEGADPSWHMVGNRREAYYSNLTPGTYLFRVKGSNNDGIWNQKEAMLRITVKPPFYKTWWAYLLYLATFSFISIRIIRYHQNKQERERENRYKQMEQDKINELHEERMRMFTNFSHELRTPLTLIINPLNDLMQGSSFSPKVKDSLQLIKRNTGRMLLLVNHLMDIRKYEAGKTILQKMRFDFSVSIREIYHSFESVADNRKIKFTLENTLPDSYFVNLDETEIEKVFFNLLSNAFKFTPPEGQVGIQVTTIAGQECELLPQFPTEQSSILIESRYLLIKVTNTGKGFKKDEAEKIFEPFYRSEEDIHHQISGTGIGLSLARSIILQHGGCIWAESSDITGTHFMFLLPDTEKQDIQQYEKSEVSKKVNLLIEDTENHNKQTILLADDNTEILEYLEQQLSTDYIVVKTLNGKEALTKIEEIYPHIVISDVIMPEINGIELCKRIKENQNYCHIPVILLTAKSMVTQVEEGLEVGADDYIVKPFQISLLKARIRNLLSQREKTKAMCSETFSLKQLGVEEPPKEDDFLTQYIEIVKANISNSELDVSVIYETLGMSRANFYRKVKSVTDLSPIELIKNIRLEAGAKLLKESNLNISEIAQQIGFSSRSYFARSFKVVYGVSPTEYQEAENKKS